MSAIKKLSRRQVMRGMLGGAAVTVGLPLLECFLNENGTAYAATGKALTPCFGTWFFGLGLTPEALGAERRPATNTRLPDHIKVLEPMQAEDQPVQRHAGVSRWQGQSEPLLGCAVPDDRHGHAHRQ